MTRWNFRLRVIVAPKTMKVGWQVQGGFAESQLITPMRYNYIQGFTYRLKLTDIPGRDRLVLYPTLKVYPGHPTTNAYLSHNSIPIALTDEDLDQIENSNFVTKVIYLPDAKYQDLVADVETLVSTRLEPGVDPVAEADRRGTIMAVIRVGNKKLEMNGGNGGNGGMNGTAIPGGVNQISYRVLDGDKGQHAAPMPIGPAGGGFYGVPGPMIAGPSMPWGRPRTGTPIGLPGPPHLPLGGPAGLRRHIMVNNTSYDMGKPVNELVIEVEHQPGIRMPKPVRHIKYTERHPHYQPRQVARPTFRTDPPCENCPTP